MKTLLQLPKWLLYGLALPLIALNGWLLLIIFQYFESLITIIVTATLLSFILDYPVKLLQKLGIRRIISNLIVLLFVVSGLAVIGITLVPIIIEQLNQLLEKLPSWLSSGSEQFQYLEAWAKSRNFPINISNLGADLLGRLSTQLQQLSGQILGSLFSALSSVLDILLTTVLTFYLLLQGQELWDGLFQLLPPDWETKIRPALRDTFHNYFVGQITVATIMGLAITTSFLILKIPFGLLFGVGVGVMAIFPFGAALSISMISFLVALKSIWLGIKVLVVAVIIEQIVESVLAPRLLGEFTGLNPALILLSLVAGAKIAGFLGLILAVPLASLIKKLVAIFYQNSKIEDTVKPETDYRLVN
jgi:predicted PurR-regulated permease PerM